MLRGKIKKGYYLGLDTSAYTTSLAVVDQSEALIYDKRLVLPVKEGGLGLRQSEAVFGHLKNMPELLPDNLMASLSAFPVAIAFAERPRPLKDSYMPVFKVGEAFGLFIARTGGLASYSVSHQEGHVMAGIWSAGISGGCLLVLHLSGGTTELLAVEELKPGVLKIEMAAEAADLNAGQFVDRLGLKMGLGFPAGPRLEQLALASGEGCPVLPVAVAGGKISFSGPASQAERLLASGCQPEKLARAIEICIADSLIRAVRNCWEKRSYNALLAVGGVSANLFIRERFSRFLSRYPLYFARPDYAADNAVGLAVIASRRSRTA